MKSIGAITNVIPFLSDKISNILRAIMNSSLSYSDFLNRIAEHILENKSHPLLVLFVVVKISFANAKYNILNSIFNKYHRYNLIQPYILRYQVPLDRATPEDVIKSTDRVLNETQNNWVRFEMYILRFWCASTHSVGSFISEEAINQIRYVFHQGNVKHRQQQDLIRHRWTPAAKCHSLCLNRFDQCRNRV